MVDELGNWEAWRELSKQFRNHVLANLDAYLYQLSEKVTQMVGKSFLQKPQKKRPLIFAKLH